MKVGMLLGKVKKFGIGWCILHRMAADNAEGVVIGLRQNHKLKIIGGSSQKMMSFSTSHNSGTYLQYLNGKDIQKRWEQCFHYTKRTNLPKLLDLLISFICSLNLSLEFFIMIFFGTNQLNINKFLPTQIYKTHCLYLILNGKRCGHSFRW